MLSKITHNRLFVKHRSIVLLVTDLIVVGFSYILALIFTHDFSVKQVVSNYTFSLPLVMLATMLLIIYTTLFVVYKVNKSLWEYIGEKELWNILVALVIAFIICGGLFFVLHFRIVFYLILIIATVLSSFFMFGIRLGYRAYRESVLNAHLKFKGRRSLIVGAGNAGYILMKELQKNIKLNAKLVGFIDDFKDGMVVGGYAVLGEIKDLPKVIAKKEIDLVFIAMPSADKKTIQKVVDLCKILNVEIKIMAPGETLLLNNNNQIRNVTIEDLLGREEAKLSSEEISEYIKGEVVLVTGAAGSIGSQLVMEIFKFQPQHLLLLDVNENGLYMLEQELLRLKRQNVAYENIKITSLIVSIREVNALESIFSEYRIDIVYHVAAHKHVPLMETRPQEAIKNNVVGTRNVIDIAIKHCAKRVIMISTDKAVNPTNVMGASKRMTELILQSRGSQTNTKIAAVRFGNVLGSNGSVIPIFKNQIEKGGPITLTSKKIIRYFMTIPEAAQLVLQAGYYADRGEIFILDMGEPVKILDLAENLIRLSGLRPYKDIDIIEIGLRPGEKMFEELQYSEEKTHSTANPMIMVNEIIDVDAVKVDHKVDELLALCQEPVDKMLLKKKLFEAIREVI